MQNKNNTINGKKVAKGEWAPKKKPPPKAVPSPKKNSAMMSIGIKSIAGEAIGINGTSRRPAGVEPAVSTIPEEEEE